MIEQMKIFSQLIMSLFISTIRPFDYDAKYKSRKWETRAEIREKHLLLKAERIFSPMETSSSNQLVLDKNALHDTPRKKERTEQNKQKVGARRRKHQSLGHGSSLSAVEEVQKRKIYHAQQDDNEKREEVDGWQQLTTER